jgi:hypothetical protein
VSGIGGRRNSTPNTPYSTPDFWGFSSVGRAPALQAGCQQFESANLHWVIAQNELLIQINFSTQVRDGLLELSFVSISE